MTESSGWQLVYLVLQKNDETQGMGWVAELLHDACGAAREETQTGGNDSK